MISFPGCLGISSDTSLFRLLFLIPLSSIARIWRGSKKFPFMATSCLHLIISIRFSSLTRGGIVGISSAVFRPSLIIFSRYSSRFYTCFSIISFRHRLKCFLAKETLKKWKISCVIENIIEDCSALHKSGLVFRNYWDKKVVVISGEMACRETLGPQQLHVFPQYPSWHGKTRL